MGKYTRLTALLLAGCLLLNTVAPASAEGSNLQKDYVSEPIWETQTITEEASASTQVLSDITETAPENTQVPSETAETVPEATEPDTKEAEVPSEKSEENLLEPNATVRCEANSYVNIRSGPGTGHPVVDTAVCGQRIHVYETVVVGSEEWGRIGIDLWIFMNYVVLDNPVIPTEPAVPSEPEETTEPSEPEETTQPSEPEETTEPSEPEETTQPSEPEEATEPSESEETTEPSEPEETTEPSEPEETTEPSESEETTEPSEPEETTEPSESEETTEPSEPEETTEPSESEETIEPSEPEETTEPSEPEETTEPTEASDPSEFTEDEAISGAFLLSDAPAAPEHRTMSLYWWAYMCGKLTTSEETSGEAQAASEAVENAESDSEIVIDPDENDALQQIITSSETQDTEISESVIPSEEEPAQSVVHLSDATLAEYLEPLSEEETQPVSAEPQAVSEELQPASEETQPSSDETAPATEEILSASEETESAAEETLSDSYQTQLVTEETLFASEETQSATEESKDELEITQSAPMLLAGTDVTYDPNGVFTPENDTITITCSRDLILLSYVKPEDYQNLTITLTLNASGGGELLYDTTAVYTDENSVEYTFDGLGSADYPFTGIIQLNNDAKGTEIRLNRPLFNAITDGTTINLLNLQSAATTETATSLLAAVVLDDPAKTANWTIFLTKPSTEITNPVLAPLFGEIQGGEPAPEITLTVSDNSGVCVQGGGYLCASMGSNAKLTATLSTNVPHVNNTTGNTGGLVGSMDISAKLTVTVAESVTAPALGGVTVTGSGDAGGLVGSMANNAELTISVPSLTLGDVETASGNAGGLAGTLGKNVTLEAALTSQDASLAISDVTATQYAGGIVGQAEDPVFTLPVITGSVDATVSSSGSDAGGLIGYLRITPGLDGKSFELNNQINGQINGLTVEAKFSAGGLFGRLDNLGGKYTIKDVESQVSFISTTSDTNSKAGGLIGTYVASDLTDTLILQNNRTTSALENALGMYGGLIGYVWDNDNNKACYVQILSGTVSTTISNGVKPNVYGGLIGELVNTGCAVEIGSTSEEINLLIDKIAGNNAAGGLVGSMPSGVLHVAKQPSFASTPAVDAPNDKRGWVLGNRDNTLVYTTDENWVSVNEPTKKTNDTGIWGQVLRAKKLDLELAINASTHTLTVPKVTWGTLPDDSSVSALTAKNSAELAAIALRLQLNEVGSLAFEKVNEAGDIDTSGGITLSLGADIDLSDTGLTSLMQDRYTDAAAYPVTIYGNTNTITLPAVTVYVSEEHKLHNRQGLITKAETLTVKDLSIATQGEYHAYVLSRKDDLQNQLYIGMLAAHVAGESVELDGVTSRAEITVSSDVGTVAKIAGILAVTDKATKKITFKNCNWAGTITDNCPGSTFPGGYFSRCCNEDNKDTRTVRVKDCRIDGGTIRKIKANTSYTPVGALICSIYYGYTNLIIDGLTVNRAQVSVAGDKATCCGGLLSFEWYRTSATVKGVEISNSTLAITANDNPAFGGLVYKGSGICTLGDGSDTEGNGILFKSGNTITGPSRSDAPSGLIYGTGVGDDANTGLYLQLLYNSYKINSDAVNLTISNGGQYFDELVGCNRNSSTDKIGIVSIATTNSTNPDDWKIDTGDCNTYISQLAKQLADSYDNPYTRYYYNLDKFREGDGQNGSSTVSGQVNSPAKMVLLSAYANCRSNLQQYFYSDPRTITGDLNLTGYSYYPIPVNNQHVKNATITFDHKALVEKENAQSNKSPNNPKRQHALMHTGIFKDAICSANTSLSLNVNDLTLRGSIGKNIWNNEASAYSSGALVCGEAKGYDVTHKVTLTVENVKLDGIYVYGNDATTPLLIANIGSFSKLVMDGVGTAVDDKTETYAKGTYAACSLIGYVGSKDANGQEAGSNIQLSFANMALDGRLYNADAELKEEYDTYHTIFTNALFIDSFRYSEASTCKGEYNFSKGEVYTLGQELSNSNSESGSVSGRNNDQQFWFFKHPNDKDYLVYKAVNPNSPDDQETLFFAEGYQRYVYNGEGKENGGTENTYCHELDINLPKTDLTDGCGTYSHPYIITNGLQLIALADTLRDGGKNEGWEIVLNSEVLGSNFASSDGHTSTPSTPTEGSEGEEAAVPNFPKDSVYVCKSDKWYKKEADGKSTPDSVAFDVVQKYLRNAYYQVEGTINLDSSQWAGLGMGSTDSAFSGVIVGVRSAEIHITPGTTAVSQYGGLIKYSQGSVVKDLSIVYKGNPQIKCDGASSDTRNASFFGGVVGWCIGGDTILDNVSISFGSNVPQVTGSSHLAAVGGHVGLVGGYAPGDSEEVFGGGVVFRTSATSNLAKRDDNHFYWNPFIGRVLDGYAMGEGIDVLNSDDNYNIPNITPGKYLTRVEQTITVSGKEGLWLLSAIANSGVGHGGFGHSQAYSAGKPRTADYGKVGQSVAAGAAELVDEDCWGGTESQKEVTYLTQFTDGDFSTITKDGAYFSIILSGDCNMTGYGNGFRGIGCSYGARGRNSRLLRVASLNGEGYTVTLAQNRKEYLAESTNWTTYGSGMFVQLCVRTVDSSTPTISNLKFEGCTGISYYNGTGLADNSSIVTVIKENYGNRLGQVGAGMLSGNLAKNGTTNILTIQNVELNNVKVNPSSNGFGTAYGGGLIGVIWSDNNDRIDVVTLQDCVYKNPEIRGFISAGGFIGLVRTNQGKTTVSNETNPMYPLYPIVKISFSQDTELSGGTIASTSSSFAKSYFGFGGLIGSCEKYGLNIQGDTTTTLTVSNLILQGNYTGSNGDKSHGGGLIGLCYNPTVCTIENVNFSGSISGAGTTGQRVHTLGGIVGALVNDLSSWNSSGSYDVTISNIHVTSLILQKGRQMGGLIGILKAGGAIRMQDVTIGSEGVSSAVRIANLQSNDYTNIGGLIGGTNAIKSMTLDGIKILNTCLQVNNNDRNTRGAALLLGFVENCSNADNPRIDIRNTTLRKSIVAAGSNKNRSGFLYGYMNKGNSDAPSITGNNLLIDSCKLGYNTNLSSDVDFENWEEPTLVSLSSDGTVSGIFGGDCNSSNTTVKLVGVSLKSCSAPVQEFGSDKPKEDGTYIIRADYLGSQYNTVGAAEPNVTVNPKQQFSGITVIGPNGDRIINALTGDGVAFDSAGTSIAKRILNESAYSKVAEAKTFFTGNNAAALSSFYTSGDNGDTPGPENFPVLELATNDSDEVTKLLACYISMLTNHKEYGDNCTPAFSTGILEIKEPVTYRWNSTGFQRVTELDPKEQNSLTFKNGKFYVTKNCYDNQKNQFTLVEVAYKDPANSANEAYHLYIPVIVKKVMEFKFWAATQIGTNYWTSAYNGLSTSTVASHGEKVTVLMGFEYQRTPVEWAKAINDGENLLWNFDKKVFIRNIASQEGSAFPNGTYLTLVDRSNQNKAFFAKVGVNPPPLSSDNMLTFSAFPGWNQEEIPLCDRLDLTATAGGGDFISLGTSGGATIRAKLDGEMTYFRLATADDDSELPRYSITVGIEGFVREEYYLTIQTPSGDSSFVNVGFECPSKIPIDGNLGLATKRIDNIGNDGKPRPYSRNDSENQLIMADFFEQEFTIESESAALISPGSNTIKATLRTALKFKAGMQGKYQTWADNQRLYQSFDIYLVEQNNDIQIPRNFANGTTLTYSYKGGPSGSVELTGSESSYRIYADSMVVSSSSIPNEGIVQEAEIYLTYTNPGIIEQFPIQPTSESSIGILICANSDWAYTKPALEYTSLHKPEQDNPPTLYHRDEASGVTLTYNAYQEISGSQSKGLSQLGVNGLEKGSFDIATAGLYDASTLKDVESARYLRCTLTLHPKVSQGNYGNAVPLGNYLTKALISAKVTNTNGQLVNATVLGSDATSQDIHSSGSIVFSLGDSFDHNIPIQLPIDLTVITGGAFEGQSFTYANYRVKLVVELLDENQGVIAYSTADDYIIYTNAKVLLGMVTPVT